MDYSSIPDDAKYITCRYCKFFDPTTNGCFLYTTYDQSWDESSSSYTRFQDTVPDNWCSHFALTMADIFTKERERLRKDGTPKVNFDDFPNLRTQLRREEESRTKQSSSGCYVATCVYGSYDCPQVWTLRRFRDSVLAKNFWGRLFICVYYAVSPTFVQIFGKSDHIKDTIRVRLDKLVKHLQNKGIKDSPYNDIGD